MDSYVERIFLEPEKDRRMFQGFARACVARIVFVALNLSSTFLRHVLSPTELRRAERSTEAGRRNLVD